MYTQIENNIFKIDVELKGNPLKVLNSYYIKGTDGGRNLLIDTGFRNDVCRTSLLGGLTELGASMEKTDIFLTHLHADHSGLATDIAAPGTRIYMSAVDINYLRGLMAMDGSDSEERVQLQNGFSSRELKEVGEMFGHEFRCEFCDGFLPVHEGDVFRYGGYELRAVLTPGHTPGHMCLYEEKSGILFLGDHVLFDITPNITFWPGFTDPLGQYVINLLKVRDYPVRLPLPAHRGIIGDMPTRIDEIIEHHGARLDELLKALREHPGGATTYELAENLSWNIPSEHPGWGSYPIAQRWFAVGETAAHLEYLLLRDQVRAERHRDVVCYYPRWRPECMKRQ